MTTDLERKTHLRHTFGCGRCFHSKTKTRLDKINTFLLLAKLINSSDIFFFTRVYKFMNSKEENLKNFNYEPIKLNFLEFYLCLDAPSYNLNSLSCKCGASR